MQMGTVTERVARGAALLDVKKPGWASEIDLDELDVACTHSCPLAQLYGSYWHALEDVTDDPEAHGFVAYDGYGQYEYSADSDALTLAWADLIVTRTGPNA